MAAQPYPQQQYNAAAQPYPQQYNAAAQPYPQQQYNAAQPYPQQQYNAAQPYPQQQYNAAQPYPQQYNAAAQSKGQWNGDTSLWPQTPDVVPRNFGNVFGTCFSKFACFTGRATRFEFWMFYLWFVLLGLLTSLIDASIGAPVFTGVVVFVLFLPYLSVTARRLHDSNKSAWNLCWFFLPYIGTVIVLVLCALASTPGPNRFGPQPVKQR